MITRNHNGTTFHYNSDMSGKVIITDEQGGKVKIDGSSLIYFFAQYLEAERLSQNRPNLTLQQEAKWNERARVFVETFQRVMGDSRSDSLAGIATFHRLKKLDVDNKLTEDNWADIIKRVR
jgi:hypothetical protein